MNKRILIIDDVHFSDLDIYLKIFNKLSIKTYCFTSQKFHTYYDKSSHCNTTFYFRETFETKFLLFQFVKEIIKTENINTFFYNTLNNSDLKEVNSLLKKTNISTRVLTLHNINSFLKPNIFNLNSLINPKGLINFYYKRLLFKKINTFNIICSTQIEYIKKFNLSQKIIHLYPCFSKSEIIKQPSNKKLIVGLPGLIEKKRRDYVGIIEMLELLSLDDIKKVRIIFIGGKNKYFEEELKPRINLLINKGLDFEVFDHFLSSNEFEKIALECSVLLCPLVVSTVFDNTSEVYGQSKTSGNFYDLVRYEKIGIFPENINLPSEIKNISITYKNQKNLSNIISDLIDNDTILIELKKNMLEVKSFFSEKNLVEKYKSQLSELYA